MPCDCNRTLFTTPEQERAPPPGAVRCPHGCGFARRAQFARAAARLLAPPSTLHTVRTSRPIVVTECSAPIGATASARAHAVESCDGRESQGAFQARRMQRGCADQSLPIRAAPMCGAQQCNRTPNKAAKGGGRPGNLVPRNQPKALGAQRSEHIACTRNRAGGARLRERRAPAARGTPSAAARYEAGRGQRGRAQAAGCRAPGAGRC